MEKLTTVIVVVLTALVEVQGRDLRPMTDLTRNELHQTIEIPAGGARILDITYRLRPVHHHDCLPTEYKSWYGKCELEEVEPGCTIIKQCPHTCTSANGKSYKLNEAWQEGNRLCRCSNVGSVFFHVPPIPPGGQPYPPINHCQLNGCRNPNTDGFMEEGDEVVTTDGRTCTCVPGPDTQLMDTATLFHLQCRTPELVMVTPTAPVEGEVPAEPTEAAPAEEPVSETTPEEPAASVEQPAEPETPAAETNPEETPVAETQPEETPVAETQPEETPVAEVAPEAAATEATPVA